MCSSDLSILLNKVARIQCAGLVNRFIEQTTPDGKFRARLQTEIPDSGSELKEYSNCFKPQHELSFPKVEEFQFKLSLISAV